MRLFHYQPETLHTSFNAAISAFIYLEAVVACAMRPTPATIVLALAAAVAVRVITEMRHDVFALLAIFQLLASVWLLVLNLAKTACFNRHVSPTF